MKWLSYSTIYELDNNRVALYNYTNDAIVFLLRELFDVLHPLVENQQIDQLQQIHPTLYAHLHSKEFIVEDNEGDAEWVLKKLSAKLSSPKLFRLTVNPTLDCNLRCWYCYQAHTHNCFMSQNVIAALEKFITMTVSNGALETFQLSFFGGEPLLKASKIALPIAEHAAAVCRKYEKEFRLHLTTNGVLLTESVIRKIVAICKTTTLQIPFDGSQSQHDKVKKTPNGKGTYRQVLQNIYCAAKYGLSVNIRCNYTTTNIDSFAELIAEVSEMTENRGNRIAFSLQRVWQEAMTEELLHKVDRIRQMLTEREKKTYAIVGRDLPPSFCYADFNASAVINYNGDVYKCTARDFTHDNCIGHLNDNGEIELTTDKYTVAKRYKAVCKTCSILPICTICTQVRCEAEQSELCPIVMTEEDKLRQIRNRFDTLCKQASTISH